jgi:hypothetical protein
VAGMSGPGDGAWRSPRRPAFAQLAARAAHVWLFDTWSLGGYLDVINVTNAANVEAVLHDYRYQQSGPVSSLPILPTLGVRGTW